MNALPRPFISTMIETELTRILHALGDPVRLQIVGELDAEAPRACGSFGHLGVGASTLSHHFKVLRDAGLVETRTEGARHVDAVNAEDDDEMPECEEEHEHARDAGEE